MAYFLATFAFCLTNFKVIPCIPIDRVYYHRGEGEDNFVFAYEFFKMFGVLFCGPLLSAIFLLRYQWPQVSCILTGEASSKPSK